MSVLDGVPVGRIEERARAARPGVAVATFAVGLLFGGAWLIAKLLGLLWLATAWCAIALAEGWRAGKSPEWSARGDARRVRAGRSGPG